jgi:hypothetical protein
MNHKINPEDAEKFLKSKEEIEYDDDNLGTSIAAQSIANPSVSNVPETGWKRITLDTLPSQGMFYPDGFDIQVRPAMVGEIRHFSTIDETDLLDVDDKLNYVLDKCTRISLGSGRKGSYKDLKEEDRFFLIFAIRDITFINGENKIFVNMKCKVCQDNGDYVPEKVELKNENFDYYQLDDSVMRFYSESEKCFVINSPKVGSFKVYVPSLGITTYIKSFIRDRARNSESIDKAFLKVAPFMFPDWRGLDEKVYIKAQQDSLTWNQYKLSAILKITEMIRFGVKTEIKKPCGTCGAEVAAQLSFQGGIKSLFIISDPFGDLF